MTLETPVRHPVRAVVAAALGFAPAAAAQTLLDRPPNVSGDWVPRPGVVQFNFLHRFVNSGAPERKVSNYPTFLLATGLPGKTAVGLNYATNSTLAPRYPNEWELFARWAPRAGAGLEVAGEIAYNVAASGVDGEISLAARRGPLRVLQVTRALSDPYGAGAKPQFALGGGATVRLSRYVAFAGDAVTLLERDSARGEQVAWSAGLHFAIPNTPHTLSLQATNTNTATLQGASRGSAQIRYGFEFTVPITLARYLGGGPRSAPPPAAPAPAPAPGPVAAAPGRLVSASIKNMQFAPSRFEVAAGTTIEWKNEDPLAHTVTGSEGSWDSGPIEPGGNWRYTFDRAGTYAFNCTPHPFMRGTVVVR